MIVIGEIEKIEDNIAFVEVAEDETTYECYMMQPLTGRVKIDLPYSVGDQVVAYLQDGRNIVMGAVYNDVDTRDSEAEFEKVLIKSKKYRIKAVDEIVESAGTIKFNSNNVLFNSGTNEGMVKIIPLVAKLNALESQVNALKTILASWTPVPNDGGAALKTLVSGWAVSQMASTQKSQLENTNVKH